MGDNTWSEGLNNQLSDLQDKIRTSDRHDFQVIGSDVERILSYLDQEPASTQNYQTERLSTIVSLCDILHLLPRDNRDNRREEPQYLDLVIRCQTLALTYTPSDDPEMLNRLSNLGTSHFLRSKFRGEQQDIDKAIEFLIQALSLIDKSNPKRADLLNSLGESYLIRFRDFGNLESIDKSIEYHTEAVLLTHEGHPQLPRRLSDLGASYSRRFERLGKFEDIEKAIEYHARALSLVPQSHSDTPHLLHGLGCAHGIRFGLLRDPQDINKSLELHTQAVALTSEDHPDMPRFLHTLGFSYNIRFVNMDQPGDIDKAIEYQARAVSFAPDGHPDLFKWLSGLGSSHGLRYGRLGELKDIDGALECHNRAILLISPDHAAMPHLLTMLGSVHFSRFERLGQLQDVDKAIEYLGRAVSVAPEGHRGAPGSFSLIGNIHSVRFERLGEPEDISKAIEYHTRAVSLAPDFHPEKPGWLLNLGNSHRIRFERLGNLKDINKAIEYHTQAASLAPQGHPFMPGWLNNLGYSHRCRFERLGMMEDIETAIECHTQAVSLVPEGHMEMPRWLNSLGRSHICRFKSLGKIEDVDKAIDCQARAVLLAPNGHAFLPRWLSDLGSSYLARYECTNDAKASLDKFNAACEWARAASFHASSGREHLQAYQAAMDLLPQLVWFGATIGQRYRDVQQIGDLALRAAAAAINAQECSLAIEWLEQGRSIVWNQTLELRTPLELLHSVDPSLADSLTQVAIELRDTSTRTPTPSPSRVHAAQRHHRLAEQYEALVSRARLIPGFEDFLQHKRTSELVRAARTGPVVVINISSSRCDALVLLPGDHEITHIPLPDLSHNKLNEARTWIEQSLQHSDVRERGFRRVRPKDNGKNGFEDALALLWRDVAKPVLDAFGFTQQQNPVNLPHITWCTTGPLSFLPLHAAGYYDQPNSKVSDFVISSYTPTVTALLSVTSAEPSAGILAVGQEATPGHNPLPETVAELASIKKHAQPPLCYTQLDGYKATPAAVLAAMEQHSWVHLACHAQQNVNDPTDSGFYLHEGTLNLTTITQKSFKNKGLAFLSACQTATGDKELADEAVHLASGMLMAGYPSVIATMWSIMDQDAPVIADKVYGQLLKGGQMKHEDAAKALHVAVGELRAKVGEKAFGHWVPYIHIGI